MVLPAMSQENTKITINGKDINYSIINNEPYILYEEIVRFGFKEDYFTGIDRQMANGKYYYQLKGCCERMGLLSAEKSARELKIKINVCEVLCKITSTDISFNGPVKVNFYNQDGICVKQQGMYADRSYTVYLPAGNYLMKTNKYEYYVENPNRTATTNWNYENTWTKSPGIYVGQTYPYPYPYPYQNYPYQNYPYQNYPNTYPPNNCPANPCPPNPYPPNPCPPNPYPPNTCPPNPCPPPVTTYPQTYISLSPFETSVKSEGTGYIVYTDDSKKPVEYFWEREIKAQGGEKMEIELNDAFIHYLQ